MFELQSKLILPVNNIKHFLQHLMNYDKMFILKLWIHQLWNEEG